MRKETLTPYVDLLKSSGLSITKQRIALLKALDACKGPVSALTLHRKLGTQVNEATVYRILKEFEAKGLVHEVQSKKDHALYERTTSHHHHIHCTSCGHIEELAVCLSPHTLSSVLASQKKFTSLEEHTLEFYGRCNSCNNGR